jgi:geranylgeranyl transferase type-1 subunit beta
MMLAYFTITSLDLLDELDSHITDDERRGYIDWIYSCQHPEGGFRGFPGTDLGPKTNDLNRVWDPANVPATYFALATLLMLKDDLSRVQRYECLQWLTKLQRADGSFGQTLGENGSIEGGRDTRFGYTAMGIRAILRGNTSEDSAGAQDIGVDRLVEGIQTLQVSRGRLLPILP